MNTMTAPQAQNKTGRRVTVPLRVVRSEWIKLRSLRSTKAPPAEDVGGLAPAGPGG